MDIGLFSEMVKELLLDNDEVTLPGLGTFVSETVPSSFSDRGYTINPPFRRLSFLQRGGDDAKLVAFYSEANGTDEDSSRKILTGFISDLKKTLQTKKLVVMPGLGRLRATKENAFFFIPDEDLDIYPYGFGLEPVSLKTHEETPEEVSAAVADLRSMVDIPEATPAEPEPAAEAPAEPEPAAETPAEPEPVAAVPSESKESVARNADWEPEPEPEEQHHKVSVWIVLACVLGLIFLFFAGFIILAHVAPDFIDSLLYTPEELRIINY